MRFKKIVRSGFAIGEIAVATNTAWGLVESERVVILDNVKEKHSKEYTNKVRRPNGVVLDAPTKYLKHLKPKEYSNEE